MEPFGIGMAGLGAAGLATFGAFGLAFRQRRKRLAATASSPVAVAAASRGAPRSTGERLEALAAHQAELGQRLEALAAQATAPEELAGHRLQPLLGLIRDKNATLETALAGLDQLRARASAGSPICSRARRRRPRPPPRRASPPSTAAAPPRPTSPAPLPTSASGWRASRRAATRASRRRSPASPRSRPASASSTAVGPRGARR